MLLQHDFSRCFFIQVVRWNGLSLYRTYSVRRAERKTQTRFRLARGFCGDVVFDRIYARHHFTAGVYYMFGGKDNTTTLPEKKQNIMYLPLFPELGGSLGGLSGELSVLPS